MSPIENRASSGLSRRNLVAAAGVLAAGGLIGEMVAAADAPAIAVEDKASSIKITSASVIPLGSKCLVKITTNHGITGWGEISQLPPHVTVALVESMYELLDGENPTRVEHLWQKLFRAHRDFRGGAFMVHTISGIDMALWDIAGKLHGVPVYRLLGGPTRDKIRVYPAPKAVKTAPGVKPASLDPKDVRDIVKNVEDARRRVGPDGTVMFDAHCMLPPASLIQFANAVEPYDLLWIEEPACPGNLEVFKRIKQQVRVPIALGERDRTIWEVIGYLQNGCIDILQFDCAHGGGISQFRKIAALCESYHVPMAPHSIQTFLGQSASFNATATIPNFLIHEFYPNNRVNAVLHKTWEVDKDGNSSLPTEPGLGCEVDEPAALEMSKKIGFEFKWPGAHYPDGSIADY
ncbi:MAG TPA: mandelate racemase/muconate lactonizing enzyme family protein [Tepidisphaeraceae bacterium]|jgi:galactonate dehydratase|nr:mandelate racemase/muconate lactonizing enzyme family protein [Tepidisphaeraceae bacterium]